MQRADTTMVENKKPQTSSVSSLKPQQNEHKYEVTKKIKLTPDGQNSKTNSRLWETSRNNRGQNPQKVKHQHWKSCSSEMRSEDLIHISK